MEIIQEVKGDFGTQPYRPKEKCYGNTVYYKRIKKKVCSKGTDTGSGGASGDSGGD
jgi:hypothetical protein